MCCSHHFFSPVIIALIVFFAVLDMVLKGFALWKAAKNNHDAWFVCIFILNTAGILPFIYLLLNRDKKE